ncbi:MAG: glycosidase [Acidobacteria bacterium]|jgi:predicted GH43/DUF377 family glycosyl hydrolase|nr:glycosidase [Acidobacteriota bacterium]
MNDFKLERLGQMMKPTPGNILEAEGVLNPAVIRGIDGKLYLFPRMVAAGNFSRIGIARVKFNKIGNPTGVEWLGMALEPEADYERHENSGGCEDPRITFVEPLQHYVMAYTAFSPLGPRIALAISKDLFHWKRLGLATFEPFKGIDFVNVDNKDASVFPFAVPNHVGKMQMALLHRPLFPGTRPEEKICADQSRKMDLNHESIWISYSPMSLDTPNPNHFGLFNSHHRLATPVSSWECLKIGGGAPPVLTRYGWLIVYHGVGKISKPDNENSKLCYSAGLMLLSKKHPRIILYRSSEPILIPTLPQEKEGTIANVVFPTGIDRRDDLKKPDCFDIYYGMADRSIGAARLYLPGQLPLMRVPGDKPTRNIKKGNTPK